MAKKKEQQLKITLRRSPIGIKPRHRATLQGLGLSKINQIVYRQDTPCNRGMLQKISYLLEIEEGAKA